MVEGTSRVQHNDDLTQPFTTMKIFITAYATLASITVWCANAAPASSQEQGLESRTERLTATSADTRTNQELSHCLTEKAPWNVAWTNYMGVKLNTMSDFPPQVGDFEDLQSMYNIFAEAVNVADQFSDDTLVMGCLATIPAHYCIRNCDNPAIANHESTCPSNRTGKYVANIVETMVFDDTRWRIFDFDPSRPDAPLGEFLQTSFAGPEDGRDRYWYQQSDGWLTITPSEGRAIGSMKFVNTFTESIIRDGIKVGGLSAGYALIDPVEFKSPYFESLSATCPLVDLTEYAVTNAEANTATNGAYPRE